ncbi:MAG TPA: NAD(P)/FAD-dependent oxidoreductase, partial [Anaerolineales bacterium]|nr:NAD(P)/FAD-dependent oxidoreductase [Anaerolineales bacterium]
VDSNSIRFDFAGSGINIRVPKRHALRVIRRDEFDHWLAKQVESKGIEIRQGVTVRKISPDANGVTVETDQETLRATLVVGADGSNGITRRSIFPNEPIYTARVLEVLTPVSPVSSGSTTPRNQTALFDFFPVPDNIAGYVWDFPTQIKGMEMRCWGIYDTNLLASQKRPALKDPLAKEMQRHGFDLNEYEIKGHPIRWYSPGNKASVSRVLLVGDAVGADVIFGEGISMALGYGNLAAKEIADSFQRGDFSFRRYKRRLERSGLGQTLFARWLIAQIIYNLKWRWFQILLWRIVKPIVLFVAWVFVLNWSQRDLRY